MKRPDAEHLRNASCLGCGYALRELTTNTCPECGRGFDPGDPSTMKLPRGPDFSWLRDTPMGRPMTATALVASVMLLVGASSPGGHVELTCLTVPLWMGILFAWMIRVIAQCFQIRRMWRRWIVVPLTLGVTMALISVHAPLRVRFAISRPFFAALVGKPFSSNRIVGFYRVVSSDGRQFCLHTGFLELNAFLYSPEGKPDRYCTMDLGGGWYVMNYD